MGNRHPSIKEDGNRPWSCCRPPTSDEYGVADALARRARAQGTAEGPRWPGEVKRRKQSLRLPDMGVGTADRSGRQPSHFTFASHSSVAKSATFPLTMFCEQDSSGFRQVPSLVQFCQRGMCDVTFSRCGGSLMRWHHPVASVHVESALDFCRPGNSQTDLLQASAVWGTMSAQSLYGPYCSIAPRKPSSGSSRQRQSVFHQPVLGRDLMPIRVFIPGVIE